MRWEEKKRKESKHFLTLFPRLHFCNSPLPRGPRHLKKLLGHVSHTEKVSECAPFKTRLKQHGDALVGHVYIMSIIKSWTNHASTQVLEGPPIFPPSLVPAPRPQGLRLQRVDDPGQAADVLLARVHQAQEELPERDASGVPGERKRGPILAPPRKSHSLANFSFSLSQVTNELLNAERPGLVPPLTIHYTEKHVRRQKRPPTFTPKRKLFTPLPPFSSSSSSALTCTRPVA